MVQTGGSHGKVRVLSVWEDSRQLLVGARRLLDANQSAGCCSKLRWGVHELSRQLLHSTSFFWHMSAGGPLQQWVHGALEGCRDRYGLLISR